jgi:hypothetical protein
MEEPPRVGGSFSAGVPGTPRFSLSRAAFPLRFSSSRSIAGFGGATIALESLRSVVGFELAIFAAPLGLGSVVFVVTGSVVVAVFFDPMRGGGGGARFCWTIRFVSVFFFDKAGPGWIVPVSFPGCSSRGFDTFSTSFFGGFRSIGFGVTVCTTFDLTGVVFDVVLSTLVCVEEAESSSLLRL